MTIGRIPSVEGGIQPTIVDAKGDLIVATAADTPARLAVGNNGDTLVADSAATTGLRYQAPVAANPIINGGMDIWQRGTSVAIPGTSTITYTADRWINARGATGQTVSRQATGDTTNLPNIQYCARVQRDSGNTGTTAVRLFSTFESANSIPYAGKTVTVSWYARAGANYSSASSNLVCEVTSGTGTDQNILAGFTGSSTFIGTNNTLTTTWQRFTATGTVAATATELSVGFYFTPVGTAGAADYFEITGVQLEVGSVATPFRRSGGTIQGELAACQRYYVRFNDPSNTRGNIGSAIRYSGTNGLALVYLPVTMRVAPTALESASLEVSDIEATNIAITAVTLASTYATNKTLGIDFTVASGLVANRPYFLRQANTTAGYLGVIAEL